MTMVDLAQLRERFGKLFGGEPRIFRAPGRVNLIGGHVDYNEGWVLPIAIDRYCHVLASARDNSMLRIHSEQFDETVEHASGAPHLDSARYKRGDSHHWSDYVRGVAWWLGKAGAKLSGADLLIASDVPVGSGLSSSAALEVSTAFALLGLSNQTMERTAIASACQRAENEFVGMRCGLMDQLAACFGKQGHALRIDCRTLAVEAVPLDESQVRVVVANTMVKHALAASEYNARRAECEAAVRWIQTQRPGVRALRDVAWHEIEPFAKSWPEKLRRRARHVTTEIARVPAAVQALRHSDWEAMRRLMEASHASLDADYQVTSPELNTMASLARELPGYCGARMTGGGFGGCTVNLVRAEHAESFAAELVARYESATGRRAEVYVCRASEGAGEIE
ncbi:MAG TPA: galactokinase [Candidatus Acidoferrales bacterium]|nr:galactokinase [Candidatus Acidoferrales bacterium]